MNYQDLNFDFVDRQRPYPPQFWSPGTPSDQLQAAVPAGNERASHPYRTGSDNLSNDSGLQYSDAAQPTIAPYNIPHAPTPPWGSDGSAPSNTTSQYGPSRLFGHFSFPLIDNRPGASQPPALPLSSASPTYLPHAMDEVTARAEARGFRDQMTMDAAGSITPGVDDGPFINFALNALTADRWSKSSPASNLPSRPDATYTRHTADDSNRFPDEESSTMRAMAGAGAGLHTAAAPIPVIMFSGSVPQRSASPPNVKMHDADVQEPDPTPLDTDHDHPPSASRELLQYNPTRKLAALDVNQWVPISETRPVPREGKPKLDLLDPTREAYPRLTALPRTLRLPSLLALLMLCLANIVLFMLSAIFSMRRPGLLQLQLSDSEIQGGQYFLFRILPQLLAAIVFVYVQCVMAATVRILPFTTMAQDEMEKRKDGLFQELYPRSYLIPHLSGPVVTRVCLTLMWLSAFTIPLASSAFTVTRIRGEWTWVSVQPVTWTLVALYFLLLGALVTLAVYWHGRITGLLWDPRSIADIAFMLYQTNALSDYEGTEFMMGKTERRAQLHRRRFDRLGYWMKGDPAIEPWYGIGLATSSLNSPSRDFEELNPMEGSHSVSISSLKLFASSDNGRAWYRYLPWCLRGTQVLCFSIGATVLLVALIVVSFIGGAAWMQGFHPGRLPAYPDAAGFSAANFVYSFVPSLLGMLLYLAFQSLDQVLRIVQPWAELRNDEGAPVSRSILLDYAACSPFQSTYRALRNKHWRVAAVSFMALLAILIPVLAGGLLMARNIPGTNQTRMRPQADVFFALLALLILYLFAVISVIPARNSYRLPHSVTCIADIISFLRTEDIGGEKGFQFQHARDRQTMLINLGVHPGREENRWFFGSVPGREKQGPGIRRLRKYTERAPRRA
ncbi:hypothetical protein SODALDRAFT_300842 [Sodiomyces alkalinus F11]|uniref:Phosphoribosylaminoimidazole-succinocarboxamide synthase n=1 Tax=Sodiomyces alkalinus (strain CBS 110278 / VKM F-3762 / F11) TaxID=1314773 RepID=A0A3N2PM15_SODAK|nr:hypothetical protein SODALDRAFT_300842 [Sodiomyces alkalinus F11]ROT35396.1 hypothetical protein SODALDRAFT_300842 [Sodiomyces alkalinus F11]